jgi:hypothetical protein
MGGKSWDLSDPFIRLRMIASSSFFGEPKYYDAKPTISKVQPSNSQIEYLRGTLGAVDPREWRSMSSSGIMEKTIAECLDLDVERTLLEAVRLRNEENIRATPQVIMVLAAMHKNSIGKGFVQKYAPQIIRRGDEPATQLAYFISKYGKDGKLADTPIPVRLRRAWRKSLNGMSEYSLSKYRMDGRQVKTIDVVRLTRATSKAIDKLVKGELKQESTWEAIISEKGSNTEAWTEALDVMGHMAQLRNIRNLLDKGVDVKLFKDKLVEGVATGKQLPFRYYTAFKAVEGHGNPAVIDTLATCLEESYRNAPKFPGRVISLVDNSGSARRGSLSEMSSMNVCDIGNLTGIVTAKLADEGYVGVFGDGLEVIPIPKSSSTLDLMKKVDEIGADIGHGTENGIWLFFDKAIRTKDVYDSIFVYSDMQAGHGGLYGINSKHYGDYIFPQTDKSIDVPKLINNYRREVNPKVKVFLVQIAGYYDSIVPEFYDGTFILGGWSAGILNFAAEMSGIGNQNQIQR